MFVWYKPSQGFWETYDNLPGPGHQALCKVFKAIPPTNLLSDLIQTIWDWATFRAVKIWLKIHHQSRATKGGNYQISKLGAGVPWRKAGELPFKGLFCAGEGSHLPEYQFCHRLIVSFHSNTWPFPPLALIIHTYIHIYTYRYIPCLGKEWTADNFLWHQHNLMKEKLKKNNTTRESWNATSKKRNVGSHRICNRVNSTTSCYQELQTGSWSFLKSLYYVKYWINVGDSTLETGHCWGSCKDVQEKADACLALLRQCCKTWSASVWLKSQLSLHHLWPQPFRFEKQTLGVRSRDIFHGFIQPTVCKMARAELGLLPPLSKRKVQLKAKTLHLE